MDKLQKVQKIIAKSPLKNITVTSKDNILFLNGEHDDWSSIVSLGRTIADAKLFDHVVNDIKLKGYTPTPIKRPSINDKSLDGCKVDVLVIGGGVTGAAILRELTKYNLSCLLIDKEEDLAMHASSRNDGCVHAGVDLHKGCEKLKYLIRAKELIKQVSEEVDVKYHEDGQTICFENPWLKPFVWLWFYNRCKQNQIKDWKMLSRKELLKREPNVNENIHYAVVMPHSGTICPYNFTIGLAESAVINGAKVSFKTIVDDMVVEDNEIKAVVTNRGTIYPKIVVNAAGTFADDIAEMAHDRFFSIHPRKGTDTIMDKSALNKLSHSLVQIHDFDHKDSKAHTKGGAVMKTPDNNNLVGPDAIEIPDKEDFSTSPSSINTIINKHSRSIANVNRGDIITYFSGIRAATYEEDFVISKGKWTKNILHAAGIQSPGLTCAPAIGEQIGIWASEMLHADKNKNFNPIRKGVVETRYLSDEERDKLIKSNPKYGHIICRCEEISEGEIVDAIHSVIPPTTVDGIKRRVRAGMGRCQGGFCQPNVTEILARETNTDINTICKKGEGRIIFRDSKE